MLQIRETEENINDKYKKIEINNNNNKKKGFNQERFVMGLPL